MVMFRKSKEVFLQPKDIFGGNLRYLKTSEITGSRYSVLLKIASFFMTFYVNILKHDIKGKH